MSRWCSVDPILDKYLPTGNKDNDSNLSGHGGVFNPVNLNLYHYAFNNPIIYTDPDGNQVKFDRETRFIMGLFYWSSGGSNESANKNGSIYFSHAARAIKEGLFRNGRQINAGLKFFGLRVIGGIGKGADVKVGKIKINCSINVKADNNGKIYATLNIGPKIGKAKAGIVISGTILENGKFSGKIKWDVGVDKKIKDLKFIMRNLKDYKNYEVGVAVGAGVKGEVRWKPYTFLKNMMKRIDDVKKR